MAFVMGAGGGGGSSSKTWNKSGLGSALAGTIQNATSTVKDVA